MQCSAVQTLGNGHHMHVLAYSCIYGLSLVPRLLRVDQVSVLGQKTLRNLRNLDFDRPVLMKNLNSSVHQTFVSLVHQTWTKEATRSGRG